jgi:hypothetical protein
MRRKKHRLPVKFRVALWALGWVLPGPKRVKRRLLRALAAVLWRPGRRRYAMRRRLPVRGG